MAATEEVWLPREVHNYDRGMMANVSVGGGVSESFSVTNGVKQGCLLAPMLFSVFLSAMLDEAFRDMGDGIYIQSRQSADLFNVTTRILMRVQLFADDSALVAHSAEKMQKIVDAFSDASKKFSLKINVKETEVLYQPNSARTREEDIIVDGNKLNSVLEFTYLRSTISSNGFIDDEIQKMAKASESFGRLRRDSGTITMCPCGLNARCAMQSCCPPSYMELRPGQSTDDR